MKRRDRFEFDPEDLLMNPAALATRVEANSDGCTLLTVSGDIDLASAGVLRDAMARALEDAASLIVDVGGVGFIDSSGLTALVWGHWEAQKAGGSFSLRRPSAMLRRLMEVTSLDTLLAVDEHAPRDPRDA
jgi:anti-sigma B factor antagonist